MLVGWGFTGRVFTVCEEGLSVPGYKCKLVCVAEHRVRGH